MNATETSRSIVAGLFRDGTQAEHALAELKSSGFTQAEISEAETDATHGDHVAAPVQPALYDEQVSGNRAPAATPPAGRRGFFEEHETHATSFVDELRALGFGDHDAQTMVDGLVKGGALVTASTEAGDLARASAILSRGESRLYYVAGAAPGSPGTTAAEATTGAVAATATPLHDEDIAATTGDRTLQLREERLQIDKQRVRHGEARISKRVVTTMQSIEVPVSHEELVIQRTAGTGQIAGAPIGTADDREIVIPLSQEVVQVQKSVVPLEEVTIGKRRVEGTEHVEDTIRREELSIDDGTTVAATTPQTPLI